ncbi:MAG: RsmB/NOP family class I SAM-dependent RNA methyltransferase, partial [Clostridia bacterium]|nr:RsmB/NOP family class I SAM-dependent RNA methyltransferase [Clostridia bacterium]
ADWVAKTAKTQKAMMKKALTLLSKGHTMVYSTCSILRDENEDVLKAVLPGMNARVLPIDPASLGLTAEQLLPVTIPGVVCVKPTALHEGFFVALVVK